VNYRVVDIPAFRTAEKTKLAGGGEIR